MLLNFWPWLIDIHLTHPFYFSPQLAERQIKRRESDWFAVTVRWLDRGNDDIRSGQYLNCFMFAFLGNNHRFVLEGKSMTPYERMFSMFSFVPTINSLVSWTLEGLYGLTLCPLRALHFASCIGSGTSEIEEYRQVCRASRAGPRTPSRNNR